MNLALKDIRYHRFKFFSSVVGVGLLLMVVLTIGGIVRGVIDDSASIITDTDADLWVVEKDTYGPFVENSRIPEDYYHAVEVIPGVAQASPLVFSFEHVARMPRPTPLMRFMYLNTLLTTKTMVKPGWMKMPMDQRFVLIGYKPGRVGGPRAIVAGRGIEADNYEIVADEKAGFSLGERLRLGYHDYTVVGLTRNVVGYTADPVLYTTLKEAQSVVVQSDPDLLRDRRRRDEQQVLPAEKSVTPLLVEPLARRARRFAEDTHVVNAIAVKLEAGASAEVVAREVARWKVLDVYTAPHQVNLQLMGSNRLLLFQMSLFRLLLMLIAGVVIGLVIYLFTLDKVKEIAVLKLLGAQGWRINGMILQEAVLMGALGTLLGGVLEQASEPYFPRRVETTYGDIGQMLAAMSVIALLASLMAVRRAMKVDVRSVLGV
ncbi:MAG TPA: ABC transporter permease [Pirellulales bacterium]|nr:ABC transporter permease [Pirellulales bacterium]